MMSKISECMTERTKTPPVQLHGIAPFALKLPFTIPRMPADTIQCEIFRALEDRLRLREWPLEASKYKQHQRTLEPSSPGPVACPTRQQRAPRTSGARLSSQGFTSHGCLYHLADNLGRLAVSLEQLLAFLALLLDRIILVKELLEE